MSTSIAAGAYDLPCFITYYFYDPYSNVKFLIFLTLASTQISYYTHTHLKLIYFLLGVVGFDKGVTPSGGELPSTL